MIIILMGVAGSGKTTIGTLLASQLGWDFADADDYHPAANVTKIRQGIALDDADREPWLLALRQAELRWTAAHKNVVLACSALKQSYREKLRVSPQVKFVFLEGPYDLIHERLEARHGHFATSALLSSQFATLESPASNPQPGDSALSIDVTGSPEQIVSEIRAKLALT